GLSAPGNTETNVPSSSLSVVGRNRIDRPSCSGLASGTLIVHSPAKVDTFSVKHGTAPSKATSPLPSCTVNVGAYPCPIRYVCVPFTFNGSLTLSVYGRAGASGESCTVSFAV